MTAWFLVLTGGLLVTSTIATFLYFHDRRTWPWCLAVVVSGPVLAVLTGDLILFFFYGTLLIHGHLFLIAMAIHPRQPPPCEPPPPDQFGPINLEQSFLGAASIVNRKER